LRSWQNVSRSAPCRSAFSDNINSSTGYAAYDRPESAYRRWAASIRARANASQASSGAMPAETAAAQVMAVIDRQCRMAGRRPPTWFFAGGRARMLWTLGLLQKTWGWPANRILAKTFGLE